jgi:hypothetical protein
MVNKNIVLTLKFLSNIFLHNNRINESFSLDYCYNLHCTAYTSPEIVVATTSMPVSVEFLPLAFAQSENFWTL